MSNFNSINNKITYHQVGDYLIPDLIFSAEEEVVQIGIWGMHRKNYLLNNNRVLFNIMLADGTLWTHLAETGKQSKQMFSWLINEMAEREGFTEQLKAADQMAWLGAMNNIKQRATEIVNSELQKEACPVVIFA